MHVIQVPYHLDDYLPDLDLPLRPGEMITADLPRGAVWERLAALYSLVGGAVAGAAGRGVRPVVVSGDCTTALGTMAGLQRAGLAAGIVWLDAHGDVQTLETTASGYLGGLPLRLLVGYRPELIAARLGLRPVPERQVLLAGARDLDPPEASYLASAGIRRSEVASLSAAGLPDGPLYVHLDLDVADPAEVPGLRYPAPGGAALAQVAGALRMLLGTGRVAAVGIACTWHPGQGAAAGVSPQLEAGLAGSG
ncbi:MAG TPA: arginase family protein [Streptosporangiaceae bacterium]|nr:arginase family protein [Streptosporangiaceae bacterium]